jgi:SAM-dependent methyltransferase
LIYSGYRNLLSNQASIARDEPATRWNLVDSFSVAKASIHFGKNVINEIILNIIQENACKGGICDLGCGAATRLLYLCRNTNLKGYGFDLSKVSIKKARENIKKEDQVSVKVQDITKIEKIYTDVEILLQAFVMHDCSDDICKKTLMSYRKTFPNAKLFIYVDAVASVDFSSNSLLPGFEYIHGLLNIKLRNKKQTLKIFKNSGFEICDEIEIPDYPNCFVWVLSSCPNFKYKE